jgi:hypothetical protein
MAAPVLGGAGLFHHAESYIYASSTSPAAAMPIADEADAPGEDLHTAAKRAYCSQIDIVKLLLAQKLSRVRRRPDLHGLSSLILDADEIRGLVRRRALEDPTMTQARKELRTTDRVVKALICVNDISGLLGLRVPIFARRQNKGSGRSGLSGLRPRCGPFRSGAGSP